MRVMIEFLSICELWFNFYQYASYDWIFVNMRVMIEFLSICELWLNFYQYASYDWIFISMRVMIEFLSIRELWLNFYQYASYDWIFTSMRVMIEFLSICELWLNFYQYASYDWIFYQYASNDWIFIESYVKLSRRGVFQDSTSQFRRKNCESTCKSSEYVAPGPEINARYCGHDKLGLLFCLRRSYFSWIKGMNNKKSLE